MPANEKEFIFVDESGDPGDPETPGSSRRFFMAAVHTTVEPARVIRAHLVNLRYHHALGGGELKEWWALRSGVTSRQLVSFCKLLEKLTAAESVKSTAVWLDKATYKADGGRYLTAGQESYKFRNYVLKRLLTRHRARFGWGDNTDLVIDRYELPDREIQRTRKFLDSALSPRLAYITAVDSTYVGLVQVADIYTKLAKQSVRPECPQDFVSMCEGLMSPREISWRK